jgi:uncharacterized protein with PQ loop repeat
MVLWIKIVTFLYLVFNGIRVFSCIPQILSIAKEESPVKTISISTWCMLSMGLITSCLYAIYVTHDLLIALMSGGNGVSSIIVIGLVIYKRKRYGMPIFTKKKSVNWATDEDLSKILER